MLLYQVRVIASLLVFHQALAQQCDCDKLSRIDKEVTNLKKGYQTLQHYVESVKQWPGGHYALVQPKTGCPVDLAFFGGTHQFQRLYTERDSDPVQVDAHSSAFSNQTVFTTGTKKFVTVELCEALHQYNSEESWPQGSYCVHKLNYKPCPVGFEEGSVVVNTETWKPTGEGRNHVADGAVDPRIGFCCRNSSTPKTPVRLPVNSPFLLYRAGGECQAVLGMSVSDEFLQVNTEDTDNKDQLTGQLPDIDHNGSMFKFHLCYYTRK